MPALYPQPYTATRRRELRRKVRNHLGAHSTDAPSDLAAVRAALDLAELLRLTTSGGIRLAVIDGETGGTLTNGQALDLARTGTYSPIGSTLDGDHAACTTEPCECCPHGPHEQICTNPTCPYVGEHTTPGETPGAQED